MRRKIHRRPTAVLLASLKVMFNWHLFFLPFPSPSADVWIVWWQIWIWHSSSHVIMAMYDLTTISFLSLSAVEIYASLLPRIVLLWNVSMLHIQWWIMVHEWTINLGRFSDKWTCTCRCVTPAERAEKYDKSDFWIDVNPYFPPEKKGNEGRFCQIGFEWIPVKTVTWSRCCLWTLDHIDVLFEQYFCRYLWFVSSWSPWNRFCPSSLFLFYSLNRRKEGREKSHVEFTSGAKPRSISKGIKRDFFFQMKYGAVLSFPLSLSFFHAQDISTHSTGAGIIYNVRTLYKRWGKDCCIFISQYAKP